MRRIRSTTMTLLVVGGLGAGSLAAAPMVPSTTSEVVAGADDLADEAVEPEHVGELGRGDALFWDGPYLNRVGTGTRHTDTLLCASPAATTTACAVGTGLGQPTLIAADVGTVVLGQNPFCGGENACFDYAFDVTERGDVLRIALDQQSNRDYLLVYLYDPDGALVGKLWRLEAERWFEEPAEGRWRARVHVFDARDTSFRMRAALDPDERRRGRGPEQTVERRSGFLLPNLQVMAPHELGFGPCQATEIVDYGAQRCLRFSTGPANVGDGPLDLVVSEVGTLEGQMLQRLHRADGTTQTVDAGTFEYHPEHVHYHHGALQSLELYRVTDPRRGGLELAGEGPKLGFCLLPYHIVEWESFAQDPPYSVYDDAACSGDYDAPLGAQMALARGFADIYAWWVEGNFVEFGDNRDGLYVIRVASDPDGHIRETRDDDNHAYTYIRVTGDDIEVLERGIGQSPWDPRRTVVDDTRRPLRWEE